MPATPLPPLPAQGAATSVTLVGAPLYPDRCASCAAPARERLTIERVFERNSTDDTPRGYEIGTVHVPFCPACLAIHAREVQQVSLPARLLLCFRSAMMISALGATFFAGLLGRDAIQRALHGSMRTAAELGVMSLLCVLAAFLSARSAYRETRRFAVPADTRITRTFEFSDDLSGPFDAQRYTYTLSNPAFAEAFLAVNRDRVWDPSSPQARRASRHRGIAMGILLAAMVIVAFYDTIKGLLGW